MKLHPQSLYSYFFTFPFKKTYRDILPIAQPHRVRDRVLPQPHNLLLGLLQIRRHAVQPKLGRLVHEQRLDLSKCFRGVAAVDRVARALVRADSDDHGFHSYFVKDTADEAGGL